MILNFYFYFLNTTLSWDTKCKMAERFLFRIQLEGFQNEIDNYTSPITTSKFDVWACVHGISRISE